MGRTGPASLRGDTPKTEMVSFPVVEKPDGSRAGTRVGGGYVVVDCPIFIFGATILEKSPHNGWIPEYGRTVDIGKKMEEVTIGARHEHDKSHRLAPESQFATRRLVQWS